MNKHLPKLSFLCLLGLIFCLGCGGGDSREYGSLSGTVMLNGKPAPSGTIITMVSSEHGAATSAQVLDGGQYNIPRAVVGTYNVGFQNQAAATAVENDPDKMNEQIATGAFNEQKADETIPEKFRLPESSGLTVTVKKGENSHDFAIQ